MGNFEGHLGVLESKQRSYIALDFRGKTLICMIAYEAFDQLTKYFVGMYTNFLPLCRVKQGMKTDSRGSLCVVPSWWNAQVQR